MLELPRWILAALNNNIEAIEALEERRAADAAITPHLKRAAQNERNRALRRRMRPLIGAPIVPEIAPENVDLDKAREYFESIGARIVEAG